LVEPENPSALAAAIALARAELAAFDG
jgi:hypothetical protein